MPRGIKRYEKQVGVALPADLFERLEADAEAAGLPISAYARECVRLGMAPMRRVRARATARAAARDGLVRGVNHGRAGVRTDPDALPVALRGEEVRGE